MDYRLENNGLNVYSLYEITYTSYDYCELSGMSIPLTCDEVLIFAGNLSDCHAYMEFRKLRMV